MSRIHAVRLAGTAVALTALVALAGCSAAGGSSGSIFGGGAKPTSGAPAKSGSGSTGSSGSGSSSTTDLSKIDPCSFFPKDAAQQLVGATLADAQDVKDPSQPSCTYNPDPSGGTTAQATLNIGAGAQNFYQIDKNQGHTFADVPGLGDEAHLERQAIFWRSGTTWFDINMLRLVDDDHQFDQPLTDAAKAVQAAYKK